MRRRVSILLAAALSIAAGFATAESKPRIPDPSYLPIARRFARQFPDEHLKHLPMDAILASRAWTNYIASLDPERVYFLNTDIEGFRSDELKLSDKLKAGDIDFAYKVFNVFMDRCSNRYEYVCSMLDKGFDTNTKETYRWKRKDLPWPADLSEWNDLWHRKVQNEYTQQIIARELARNSTTNTVEAHTAETNAPAKPPEDTIRQRYKQLMIVLSDADAEFVLQKYLTAFAQAYDPHSSYMSLSSMDDFDIEMKLSLVGIGALLSSEDGAAKVVRLIPGGPADMDTRPDKKLQPNDRIIAVAEQGKPSVDVLHWPLNKVVKLIRGEKGSRVILTIIPASDPTGSTTKTVDLVRDEVKLEEQEASVRYETVKDGDGVPRMLSVITLPTFYANMKAGVNDADYKSSAYDVAKLLNDMEDKKVDGIILDLRNNGGGALMEAIKLTGLFITTGPTVQVKERYSVKALPDLDPNVYYTGPLIVLVNRLSASASEIVAGALQDYGRAIIVGDTKTHGKGSVQTILDVGRDKRMGSIKITTACFYRITGSSTQLRGITPDIVIHSPFDYMELGEETLPNAMEWTTVAPASYRPVGDASAIIPVLKEKSGKRRSTDPRFAAYTKVLERIESINKTDELPLNLDERRALAKSEKELNDLQAELDPDLATDDDAKPDKKKDLKRDLILSETLSILADYVAIEKKPSTPVEAPAASAPATKSLSESIAEWLRDHL